MNVPLTYPGVYIDEGPTRVRSIPGVDTAITAFIGSALRGVENEPVLIQDFGVYERTFGSLSRLHPMSFAVSQFFNNGGQKALIVRVVRRGVATPSTVTAGTLELVATYKPITKVSGHWIKQIYSTCFAYRPMSSIPVTLAYRPEQQQRCIA